MREREANGEGEKQSVERYTVAYFFLTIISFEPYSSLAG